MGVKLFSRVRNNFVFIFSMEMKKVLGTVRGEPRFSQNIAHVLCITALDSLKRKSLWKLRGDSINTDNLFIRGSREILDFQVPRELTDYKAHRCVEVFHKYR